MIPSGLDTVLIITQLFLVEYSNGESAFPAKPETRYPWLPCGLPRRRNCHNPRSSAPNKGPDDVIPIGNMFYPTKQDFMFLRELQNTTNSQVLPSDSK